MTRSPLRSTVLPLAAGAIFALPLAAQAEETKPLEIYGQLNFGLFSVDDGVTSETFLSDNDNSNTRIGLIYRRDLNNGNQLRFHFETALGLRGSSGTSIGDNDLQTNGSLRDLRKFELIYQTAKYGTFSFGQGSVATDSVAEADFSGTSVIAYSSLQDIAGSNLFTLGATGASSGVSVGNAFSAFDGGRRFRLKYDTPTFGGFGVSVSAGEEVLTSGNDDEFYDIAVRYNQTHGDFKVAGRLGYAAVSGGEETILGSIAAIHEPTGLNFTIASGSQEEVGDASYVYVKAGIKRDWFDFGETAISLDYYEGDDFVNVGSSSSSYGLAVVQKIDKSNLEIFATYRNYEFDDAATGPTNDLELAAIGARYRF